MSQPTITVTIKLFAAYQEAFGITELQRSFPPQTPIQTALDQLLRERPELEQWRNLTRFGLNYQFVSPDTPLQEGDEVVFIPPVSGG